MRQSYRSAPDTCSNRDAEMMEIVVVRHHVFDQEHEDSRVHEIEPWQHAADVAVLTLLDDSLSGSRS